MTKATEEPSPKRVSVKEIKVQLDMLTEKLKSYEDAARCTVAGCKYVSDGLRLSQEVELLHKEMAALRQENEILKKKLG